MKAVIFDLGRVLIEYDQQATMEALANVSRAPVQQIRQLFGSIATKLDIGEIGAIELHRLLVEQMGTTTDYSAFEAAFCISMARNEEALNYVAHLRSKGIKIGIISNTNQGHSGYLHKILPELKLFDTVIFSNEVGLRKPNVEIYQLALHNLGILPAEAIFVDDISENVMGAQLLGMGGIIHREWTETSQILEQRMR